MTEPVEIDAHHHLWRLDEGAYAWIRDRLHLPNMARIARDFELPEYHAVLDAHGVRRSLLVQTERTAVETDQMLARARGAEVIAGVVGWVDFEAADAADDVRRRADDPLIKGLRIWLLGGGGQDWIFGTNARAGLDAARGADLPLELLSGPRQLDATIRLMGETTLPPVAICHAGKPDIGGWQPGSLEYREWATGMARLAEAGCFVKLSGVVTECGDEWRMEQLRPYWDLLAERFGPARMIWGSDWPVIERAGGYGKWLDAVRTLAADLPAGDRQSIFGGAARAFYRL